MSSSRPGGLTALALINIFFGLFATVSSAAAWFIPDIAASEKASSLERLRRHEEQPYLSPQQVRALEQDVVGVENFEQIYVGHPVRWKVVTTFNLAAGLLMLTSGVGLWRTRAFAGRWLGVAFVALSIGGQVVGHLFFPGEGDFSLFSFLLPLYGLMFLYLVNVVFAADLD